MNDTAALSGSHFLRFFSNGSPIGSIANNANTAVAFNTTSDRRTKENVTPSAGGLDLLMKIGVANFNFIKDPSRTRVQGLIAQDVAKVYPEAVTTNGDDGVAKLTSSSTPWSIDYGRLTPLIIKSVQELQATNDNLVSETATLRAQLKAANDNTARLEQRLERLERQKAR